MQGPGKLSRKLSLNLCVIQIHWKHRIYWFPDFRFTMLLCKWQKAPKWQGGKER